MARSFVLIIFSLLLSLSGQAEKPVRILSLDGGGMRGIIEIVVLSEMERELEAPISEIFDMVVGSSTGGLVALILSLNDEKKQPRFEARDLLPIYQKHGKEIFHASLKHKIATGFGLWGPKYEADGLMKNTNFFLGTTKMSEARLPVVLTGYHVAGENGVEFSSLDAQAFPEDKDCLMKEAALATTAAPLFFDLADVHYSWGVLDDVADGGLYRNNPVLVAYTNARRHFPGREIEIYSVGAGKIPAEELTKEFKGRGIIQWLSPIIRHVRVADSETDNDILHKLLNHDGKEAFFRLNIPLDSKHRSMDNTSKENISYLMERGIAATNLPTFKRMIDQLKLYR